MSTAGDVVSAAVPPLLGLAAKLAKGEIKTVGEAVRAMVGIGLELVPHDELARYLSEFGKARAEMAADGAEFVKFGSSDLDEID